MTPYRSFDGHRHRLVVCVVVLDGEPPWLGGDGVVHLDERDPSRQKLFAGCGTPVLRAVITEAGVVGKVGQPTTNADSHPGLAEYAVRPVEDLTCDGCTALAVARLLQQEPDPGDRELGGGRDGFHY